MGGLILSINTLYTLSCFLKQFALVDKGLILWHNCATSALSSSQVQVLVFSAGNTLCFAVVLAKIWRVYYIFSHLSPSKKVNMTVSHKP